MHLTWHPHTGIIVLNLQGFNSKIMVVALAGLVYKDCSISSFRRSNYGLTIALLMTRCRQMMKPFQVAYTDPR